MAGKPETKQLLRTPTVALLALAGSLWLAGCAQAPAVLTTAPASAPAQPALQELMQQAQAAQREGQRERARQAWRAAAKAYPAQKAPWQKLAEDYFDTADYGNAILAAQEVLQRDDRDTLAHSVVALSGLRLSTVSLSALRDRGSYPVGSREEAQGLARSMRESLGEAAPPPARTADAAPPRAAAAALPAVRSGGAPAAAAVRAPAPLATASAPTATAAGPARAQPVTTAARPLPPPAPPAARPAADPFRLLNQ